MSCVSYITELHTTSTEIVDSAIVEVTTANNVATINTSTSKVAEVIPNNYTLSSGGIYSGYLNGNAPQWIADIMDVAISDYLSTNYDNILDTYETQIENLELGVNQNIVSIQNSEQSLNALITSTKSELDGNIAGVSDIVATKVDAASASALVRTLVGSRWLAENESTAESYIEGIATTKVQEGFAENVVYNQLVSAVNDTGPTGHGLTALATARDLMFTKTGMDPVTGALGATSGYFQELYAEVGDNATSITTVENVAATAYTWSAKSVKKLEGADGSNMGFQLISAGSEGEPSATERSFTVVADTFKIVNPDDVTWVWTNEANNEGYFDVPVGARAPFSVNSTTNEVSFDGKVSFTNVTGTSDVALVSNLPTYTSGTVNPTATTEPIQSVYLNTTDSSLWTYTSAGWVPGGDPDAITQATLNTALADNTTVINGSKIITGTIDATKVSLSPADVGAGSNATTGSRMNITSDAIKIYQDGILRVVIGNLS